MSISIDSLSIALAHVEQLIASVGKKGSKQSSVAETFEKLNQILSNWGREAEVYLLRVLFSSVDFTSEARTKANEFVSPQAQLLHQLIVQCAVSKHKRGFVSHLGEAFDRPLRTTRCPGGIAQIGRVIRLSPVQQVVFAISLLQSTKSDTRASAVAFLRDTLPSLLKSYSDSGTTKDTGLQDCAVEAVHLILTSIDEDADHFTVSAELKESFLSTLKRDFPADGIPVILLPWLSGNRRLSSPSLTSVLVDFAADCSSRSSMMDAVPGSAASLLPAQIQEIGYALTATMDSCRQHLTALKANDHTTINPVTVARILTTMVQTHSNLKNGAPLASVSTGWIDKAKGTDQPTSWDVQIFAKTVNEMSPNLNWSEVVMQLDQPGFCVRDRAGLQLLTAGLLAGLEGNVFPIALLYREWNFHKNGQLSWISQILQNPDVFCFADYPHRQVQMDLLKMQPEDTNKETANWKSLDLIDVLLKLSDAPGQSADVQQAFRFPIANCPDVLMLGLLQVQPPMNALRQELLQVMMPVFLGNHPNAMVVLNYAWNSTMHNQHALRNTILNAMANFYLKSPDDQAKLTRVLEVAHELKPNGLAALFNLPQYLFTIDLACLASRRDFLKLDKWINDKIQEHQEPFVQHLIQFLKRRWPTASFGTPGTQGLPTDIIQTLLGCLHTVMAGAPSSIANDISVLLGQFRQLQMAAKSDHQSGPKTPVHMNQPSLLPPAPAPIVQPQPLSLSSAFGGQSRVVEQLFGGSGASRGVTSLFPSRMDPGSVGSGLSGGYPTSSSGFGMASDGLKTGVSGLGSFGSTPTPFGNPHPMAASPSSVMMRSAFGRSPAGPAQQGTPTGWGAIMPSGGPMRTAAGALTPSSNFDFRLNMPPTNQAPGSSQGMQDMNGPGGNIAPSDDPMAAHFSEEIQAEANSYFQQIYAQTGQMPVGEFVAKLKQFRTSPNSKDRDVLACVVKNLFEEYRFFHDYPDRELRTTAEVYGGIIREGIISSIQFATAVRKVIESLQAEPNSRLWTFGIVALSACRTKLSGYPKVCSMIMSNPNFANFPQSLKDYVTAGCKGQLPAQPQGRETPSWQPQVRPSSEVGGATGSANGRPNAPAVLSMTSVDTLVNATEKEGIQLVEPPENVVEKVSFLFNNLSQSNLPKKTEEMRTLIEENGKEFVRWLAQYMVMKRVSIEQNFQPLYNNFLCAINDKQLEKACKEETFRNIRILLRSDKRQAASNFGDRQLLKNLGMWLGMITIAKDTPILSTELDLKALLMEAYYKGQQELLFVVPFVAKIIASCSKSEVFFADCAWIRAMIKILAELHCEPDLKLNLKFEIEVLCKELQVDLRHVELEGVLKDTDRLVRVPQQLGDLKLLKQPDTATQIGPSPIPSATLQRQTEIAETGAAQAAADDSAGGQSTVAVPAHFFYHDINVTSFQGLAPHLKISATIPLFQMNPQLKHVVRPAVDHAVKELIGPVTERAIKVAMTATEHVCRKDFSLDPDENKLRRACHHMMRAMTAGMAAITCRDPLTTTLQGYLKQAFLTSLRGSSNNPEQLKLIDEAATLVTEDNIELATNFIVKTACEKATPEVDKRMDTEYQLRQLARRENRPYSDAAALSRAQSMPEQIRLKSGAIGQQQMAVYDEFSSKICGFKPTTAEDMIVDFPQTKVPMPATTAPTPVSIMTSQQPGEKEIEATSQQLQQLMRDIDNVLNPTVVAQSKPAAAVASIRDAISQLVPSPRDPISAVNLVQRLVEQLLHAFKNPNMLPPGHHDLEWHVRLREAFIATCRILMAQFGYSWLQKCVTKVLIDCRLEYRFNLDAIDVLMRSALIQMPTYDLHLSTLMDNGSNFEATLFAQRLIKLYLASGDRNQQINAQESLSNTFDILNRLSQFQGRTQAADPFSASGGDAMSQRPPAMQNMDMTSLLGNQQQQSAVIQPIGSDRLSSFHAHSALGGGHQLPTMSGRAGDEDPPDLQSKVEMILRDWIQLCYTPIAQREPQTALAQIVNVMHEHGVLSTDDMISRFFRLCTEMCVDVSYRLLKTDTQNNSTIVRQRCYYTLDAFVKLTCLMVKHSDGGQYQTKINLLKKVLNIVTSVLHQDHEVRRHDFHAMPYHRILIMMFNELTVKDSVLDPIAWNILEAFGQALFILQPRRVPGFAYSWLDIVGHRNFIGRMLSDTPEPLKTAAMYTQLIICHLKFLAPFLRNIELPKSIAMMYKGTLRVLLVILHDFPELLCEYHYVICDAIPPNCVQLRNLILSAYPRNMRLPDPFMQNLKVDNLVEITHQPKIHVNLSSIIPPQLRTELDSYLENRAPVSFLSELPRTLQVTQTSGSKYNVTIMNAVVLYVGMRAIEAIQDKQQRVTMSTIAHTAYMDIFQNLAVSLCTEGRYLLFNAIANQLRYPNSHTHYFSCTLLYLFLEANTQVIQEQITRILFERLVALRPHPWGLLITFIELIKNAQYGFWQHEFTRCAPEIERLFQSVANSCMGNRTQSLPVGQDK